MSNSTASEWSQAGRSDWQSVAREAGALLAASERIHSPEAVATALDAMATDIRDCYGEAPLHALSVMNGGFYPCAELLQRLRNPMYVDYLHATRYRGGTRGAELIWKVAPPADLAGRDVLIVDDILDEGHTLQEIVEAVRAGEPASVRVAVLLRKEHGRCVDERLADFVGLRVPDRYVFGCGMDVHGFWRQLPEVRALKAGAA
jgi:hypoxanthine phosphoribosyltransferase